MNNTHAARAAKGAALLDNIEPGWYRRIDTDNFYIDSVNACILGQLFDGWLHGCWVLEDNSGIDFTGTDGRKNQTGHGFELANNEYLDDVDHASLLENAWTMQIIKRDKLNESI